MYICVYICARVSNWRISRFVVPSVCDVYNMRNESEKINSCDEILGLNLDCFNSATILVPLPSYKNLIHDRHVRFTTSFESRDISLEKHLLDPKLPIYSSLIGIMQIAKEWIRSRQRSLLDRRRERGREKEKNRLDRSKLAAERTELEHARSRSYLSWLCQARWASLRSRGSRLRPVRRIKPRRPPVYRMQQDWQPP